jgi:hypothetical protein
MARSGKATINTMASLPGCQHSNQREACSGGREHAPVSFTMRIRGQAAGSPPGQEHEATTNSQMMRPLSDRAGRAGRQASREAWAAGRRCILLLEKCLRALL